MEINIYWRFIIQTKKIEKIKKIEAEVVNLLPNSQLTSRKPYWKDDALYEVEFIQKIFVSKREEDLIYKILIYMELFSSSWNINLSNITTPNLEFSGVTENSIKVIGVKWISFMTD